MAIGDQKPANIAKPPTLGFGCSCICRKSEECRLFPRRALKNKTPKGQMVVVATNATIAADSRDVYSCVILFLFPYRTLRYQTGTNTEVPGGLPDLGNEQRLPPLLAEDKTACFSAELLPAAVFPVAGKRTSGLREHCYHRAAPLRFRQSPGPRDSWKFPKIPRFKNRLGV